jgi:heat shock protein HslJ
LLSPGFDLSEFRNSFWCVIRLDGKPIADPDAELRLDGGTIEASMGKFRANFEFRYSAKKIVFDGPSLSGLPDYGFLPSFFEIFGQALRRIATYSANGDELAAMDVSGQQVMLLRRIPPTGLEYRYWHIAQYGLDGWLSPTISPPQVITFVRGKLQGWAGCRGWSGNYRLEGDSLSVDAGDNSGTGTCPIALQNEERIILYVLNKASRVKEDGDRMLLQDAEGKTHIVLVPYARQRAHKTLRADKDRAGR